MTVNPEITRDPSPNFLIPEPSFDNADGYTSPPPTQTTPSKTLSPPPFSDHSNVIITPPSTSPVKTNSWDLTQNDDPPQNAESRLDRSKTFAVQNSVLAKKEIICDSNSPILDSINNNNNNNIENGSLDHNTKDQSTAATTKKKSKKKRPKKSDDINDEIVPRTLQPITGLNRDTLPPLRANMLPPLK